MSAERRRRAAICVPAATLLVLTTPSRAAAHGIDAAFQLPLPLWLYLAGAGIAVAASFVVTARVSRVPTRASGGQPVPEIVAGVARSALRVVGLAWWYGAIGVGFVVGDISPLPAVLLWVGIWVGLPIAAALLGNPWPSLSPFRTTYAAIEWLARRAGLAGTDLGLPYPRRLARWPAALLLLAGIWAELILPGRSVATTVAALMTGYTLLTLLGCLAFGPIAWLRNGELFEVLLGWFGRIGPIGRRSMATDLCADCTDDCDPRRCIDCPECSVAADDGERRPELRPWFAGLAEPVPGGWSDAAVIVVALAGVTYDGMRETAFGAALLDLLLPPFLDVLGLDAAFLMTETAALALVVAAFVAAFVAVLALTRRLAHGAGAPAAYASTLLPIAAGYLVAHYGTLVVRGAIWLPTLVVDPLMSLAPDISWIPAGAIWYVSVAAIVGGHVAGIVLAHRLALRGRPDRAALVGLPMVALMIGYTVLSLWIIAQPIVVEPGVAPAAFR